MLEGSNPEDKMIRRKVKSTLPTKEQILKHLNDQQKKVVKFFCGAALVVAVAGSGKTRALVHRIAYLIAVRRINPQSILAVTFSKKAADEMTERLEGLGVYGCRVGTWHSLCYEILRKETELGEWDVDSKDRFRVVVKQVLGYQGMNWKKADLTKVLSFISLCKANLAEAGSEKAEEIAQELFDSNPCAQNNPALLVEAYYRSQEAAEARQLLTFDDMLVFTWRLFQDESVRVRWASRFEFVLQDEAQDANLAQIEIASLLSKDHRNYMCVGDPGQCHPPGVNVRVSKDKVLPIEQLVEGQSIQGWNRNAQKMVGGRSIKIGRRSYVGKLFDVHADNRNVPMTPNHRVLCRWTDRTLDSYVTYLMYRSDLGFRVGWCKLFSSDGLNCNNFHLGARSNIEKAEKVWILKVHKTRRDASVYESIVAAKYGIPTSTFEPVNGAKYLTRDSINQIFEAVKNGNFDRGDKCLFDHNKMFQYQLFPYHNGGIRGTYFEVFSVNIEPGLMSIAVDDLNGKEAWFPVDRVDSYCYSGDVYSLDVDVDHSYSANGLVVLNSIYGFRGALPEKLLQFQEDWNAEVIKMHINYRSANEILEVANNVIDSMDPGTHLNVKIEGAKNSRTEIKVHELMDQDVEGERIANEILELNSSGMSWKDIAVLYRTNAQSRGVEEQLISHRIPYVVIGGTNFYDRKEVKDLLSYLRCAVNRDEESFKRCINAPFRYLGNVFRDRVVGEHYIDESWTDTAKRVADQGIGVQYRQKTSVLEWANLIDSISRAVELRHELEGDLLKQGVESDTIKFEPTIKDYMPAAILERIVEETDYNKWITRDEGAETVENNRVSNVRELIRAAERFTTVEELLEYIDMTLEASKRTRANKDKDRVILTTLHRSKGLEWKTVFIIGVSEKILPHGKAEDLGEERRLFYVGVTRAMDNLYISSIRSAALGQGVFSLEPSRFLEEARLSFQNTGAISE